MKLLKACLLDKQSLLMRSIPFLMTYLKTCFWTVICTPVIWHSQWHYWLSSLHKGYPWYKFPSHTISWSWDTSEDGGVYLPLPPLFLTHVSIWQMPTWLPTWKAKSLYHVSTFLPTWFLPLQKFKTIKIKREKNLYTQANTCLLHISRNFKDIFKYIWFTLSLANCKHMTKRNRLYRSSLSAIFFFNRY